MRKTIETFKYSLTYKYNCERVDRNYSKIEPIFFNTSKEALDYLTNYYDKINTDLTFPEFMDEWKFKTIINN
tara:strand:- start:698 stop:913 length:216 start_codon:yes stop_codon:yes gene_type:complete